jgi:hypothetical protein
MVVIEDTVKPTTVSPSVGSTPMVVTEDTVEPTTVSPSVGSTPMVVTEDTVEPTTVRPSVGSTPTVDITIDTYEPTSDIPTSIEPTVGSTPSVVITLTVAPTSLVPTTGSTPNGKVVFVFTHTQSHCCDAVLLIIAYTLINIVHILSSLLTLHLFIDVGVLTVAPTITATLGSTPTVSTEMTGPPTTSGRGDTRVLKKEEKDEYSREKNSSKTGKKESMSMSL